MSDWLNAREAAAYVGRTKPNSHIALIRKAKRGEIKAGHDGQRWMFYKPDLDASLYRRAKEVAR